MSTHYSQGAGLTLAFMASKQLAKILYEKKELPSRGKIYSDEQLTYLKEIQKNSINSMLWQEGIERHYVLMGGNQLINGFKTKHEGAKEKTIKKQLIKYFV